ncbi:UNVERIFIED_ORG: putative anaerobic ribonucleoside-triphosphate reductase [Clostridioides difficile F501]
MEAVVNVRNAMDDMVVSERLTVDGVTVQVGYANEGDQRVTEAEIRAYIERGALKHVNSAVTGLALLVDGEDVNVRYDLAPVPFDRIRRITGYLVGTMDRWNDAKTFEEADRVKHGVCRAGGC